MSSTSTSTRENQMNDSVTRHPSHNATRRTQSARKEPAMKNRKPLLGMLATCAVMALTAASADAATIAVYRMGPGGSITESSAVITGGNITNGGNLVKFFLDVN